MGIIGSMLGRREPQVDYRTIDGGHPAPYPDMTDEQLYNYEVTFNVPRRTFAARPQPPAPPAAEAAASRQPGKPAGGKNFDAPRYTARTARESGGNNLAHEAHEAQPARRSQAWSGKSQQAPPAQEHVIAREDAPPLDFGKPVRIVTSKVPVEIITTRARHPVYKVHGYIGNDDIATVFTLDGRMSENGPRYLENVPQAQQLHLNVYPAADRSSGERYRITQHATREEADAAAQAGRLACVDVRFDL